MRVLDRVGTDAAAFSRAHGVGDDDIARWRERTQAGGRGGVSSRRS